MLLYRFASSRRWLHVAVHLLGEFSQVAAHRISVLTVGIIFRLDFEDFKAQRVCVEIECGAVAFADVKTHILCVEAFNHSVGSLIHEFLGESETAEGSLHRQRRDVSVFALLARLGLLHFRQNVADDVAFVVFCDVR